MPVQRNFNEIEVVDLKDIKAIIDLMRKNSVSEFELEKQDFKIRLKRGPSGGNPGPQFEDGPVITYAPPPAVPPAVAAQIPPAIVPTITEVEIKSPMIGTFYRA